MLRLFLICGRELRAMRLIPQTIAHLYGDLNAFWGSHLLIQWV